MKIYKEAGIALKQQPSTQYTDLYINIAKLPALFTAVLQPWLAFVSQILAVVQGYLPLIFIKF